MEYEQSLLMMGENINNMTNEEMMEEIDFMYDQWIGIMKKNLFEYLDTAILNYGLTLETIQLGNFEKKRL